MPGIEKASIRTKSAYGSLREAKVEFTWYNQKQLEALEMLYMWPGVPVLVEWGWTNYIDNNGKRRSDFPFMSEWWIREFPLTEMFKLIIDNKIQTGGKCIIGVHKN